jgi:hypothetical protein
VNVRDQSTNTRKRNAQNARGCFHIDEQVFLRSLRMGSLEDSWEHLEQAKDGSELVSATKAMTWIEFATGS